MKRISYLIAAIGIAVGILESVRVGAIAIAVATALFVAPDFRALNPIQRLIPVALIVSLITVSLALPRH